MYPKQFYIFKILQTLWPLLNSLKLDGTETVLFYLISTRVTIKTQTK